MRTKKLKPEDMLKGIYLSAEAMEQPFSSVQEEILIDLLSEKKPQLWLMTLKKNAILAKDPFTEEQVTMIGTALHQNYSAIPTLMSTFPEEGFHIAILDGIKETVKKKGKISKQELQAKALNRDTQNISMEVNEK